MAWVRRYHRYLAWLVSLVAVGGSLYFSEVMGYIPCELCWVQRIFMYPLAIMLGIATYLDDSRIIRYALPLSLTGGLVSVYHYMKQKMPGFDELAPCTQGVPCSGEYINWLGFITIPFLALIAFILISLLLWVGRNQVD
ncbi:disulfide oxidoreductase [Desmospora profundinema]|uniref:Disulfide bond formation protein DsbB n=1 Tax=Desmospora profundinema TaxID=1571184 RepID=A0ABU1IQX6_9BACL|nr:disulfide oxidoreductase [Desmospora profundinema]MDR6226135.1 disulfide bond formation protein DsbB [Desmospora profundinema]